MSVFHLRRNADIPTLLLLVCYSLFIPTQSIVKDKFRGALSVCAGWRLWHDRHSSGAKT